MPGWDPTQVEAYEAYKAKRAAEAAANTAPNVGDRVDAPDGRTGVIIDFIIVGIAVVIFDDESTEEVPTEFLRRL